MGKDSKIEWTKHTWNPWRGCTKISAGCTNCYADALSKRNPAVLGVWGDNGTRVVASESKWREPIAWDKAAAKAGERHRVFCASLADVFEDWKGEMVSAKGNPLWWCHGSLTNSPIPSTGITDGCRMATMKDIRERLFQLIDDTPNLDWLLVTKRPENWRKCWPLVGIPGHVRQNEGDGKDWAKLPNVWLGVSVENQEAADDRIPILLSIPAAVRFLSVEPMLGPIDFYAVPRPDVPYFTWRGETGVMGPKSEPDDFVYAMKQGIDWAIFGGESGPGARPCNVEWIRDGVRQCREAGVAPFVKQLGANIATRKDSFGGWNEQSWPRMLTPKRATEDVHGVEVNMTLDDSHGGDWDEWPEDLKVREFPTRKAVAVP